MADEILEDWLPGTTNYHIRASVVTSVSALYTLFVIVTLVMFIVVARNRRSGLEKRSAKLVLIQALGCYLAGVDGLVTAALNNWACFAKLWLFNIGFMVSLSAMSARAFHLMVVYKVHELTSKLSARDPQQMPEDLDAQPMHGPVNELPQLAVHSSLIGGISGIAEKHQYTSREQTLAGHPHSLVKSESRLRLLHQLNKYRRLLPYATERVLITFILISTALTVVLSLVINITNKQFALRPVQAVCAFFWGFLPVTVIIVVYFFLVFPFILWRVWYNRDAYGIRHDLIICDTIGVVVLVVTLVWVNVLQETQQIWPGLSFIWIYAILIHVSSVFVPLLNAIKHNRSTHEETPKQARRLSASALELSMQTQMSASSRRLVFNRMLDNADEYQKFRTFAVSCFSSELTTFIEEYQVLKAEALALLSPHSVRARPSTSTMISDFGKSDCSGKRRVTFAPTSVSASLVNSLTLQRSEFAHVPTTSVTVSILDTLTAANPELCGDEAMRFPQQLHEKLKAIYWDYIDPSSYTSVNATPLTVRRITDRIHAKEYTISLLDELKDEVLFMLYSDVYTRYIRKL
ncbi:hypothetical protein IWW54_004012 [Coemansia sp. RSA 2705]|nr:hypothetical protein IWW54_004012 [Coemansia sp. RSA 2705]